MIKVRSSHSRICNKMIMFIALHLTLFLFHPTSINSKPGYIEHLRTLNNFSFPVSVQFLRPVRWSVGRRPGFCTFLGISMVY